MAERERNAMVVAEIHGAKYYLTKAPREWVLEREHADDELDVVEANTLAGMYGGTVVALGQKREVAGQILGVADGGRRF